MKITNELLDELQIQLYDAWNVGLDMSPGDPLCMGAYIAIEYLRTEIKRLKKKNSMLSHFLKKTESLIQKERKRHD